VVANWSVEIAELRSKALTQRVQIAERPIIDGRWHVTSDGSGAYLLFTGVPFIALFAGGDGVPEVWRRDGDRLLTRAQEQCIAEAIRQWSVRTHSTRNNPGADRPAPARKSNSPDDAPLNIAPASIVAAHNTTRAAAELLSLLLTKGPLPTVEIKGFAEAAEISWASVRRARALLNIVATLTGFGRNGKWSWQIP
jgi:hypothetical protein